MELNIEPGDKKRLFLDYFNAAIRTKGQSASASGQFLEDGSFVSDVRTTLPFNGQHIPITWVVTNLPDGTLASIEPVISSTMVEAHKAESAAKDFLFDVLNNAFRKKHQKFFRQVHCYYIGPQLDGEYWFGTSLRFAPAFVDDPKPYIINAERVLTMDFNVTAIDEHDASNLAVEQAKRYAARLSLLLNVGIYFPAHQWKWTMPDLELNTDPKPERRWLGFFLPTAFYDRMPQKKALCPLGKNKGALIPTSRMIGELLSLPQETRRIFRGLDNAKTNVADGFDACARLFQVALTVGPQFPSIGLAYRVAAVEALSKSDPPHSFSSFVRQYTPSERDLDAVLDYLYGSIRSAHFHAGIFPAGEFGSPKSIGSVMDGGDIAESSMQAYGVRVLLLAVADWLKTVVLGQSADE